MIVFNSLDEIKDIDNTAVAVGNFDGVHKGHRALIENTVKTAGISGHKSAVFTFSELPKNVMAGETKVKSILYKDDKARIIEELGVDYLFNIPFTKEICQMGAYDFVSDLLIDKFKMKELCCGFNYRFGYMAAGDLKLLLEAAIKCEFGLHIIPPFRVDGNIVSSTLIRKLIADGKVDECIKYLGRRYSIGGQVVVGNKLGRTIGFPTSNLVIDESMVTPPNGVYVTYCIYNKKIYPSITNVGVKPTIGEYNKNVETHIFNFDKELYGKQIRVEFLKKTRDERKFASIEALTKQITQDCIQVKAFHRQNSEVK
ncbi:MAG: bifunctional riboflavin kinase/FAD synthetase [Eubacteriaceae bacterium]|jgi:riboflavin kinase/FMN adenylyltransferase|nr:bifunctional riboflavin kinase/FAD synthetase [Eubacteriaceae bacterium]